MQLMMYIGNDLIEAIPIDGEQIRRPGYLGSFKRFLKQKYSQLISQSPQPPDFLVIELNPPAEGKIEK
jgi:hypothetical protein